MYIDEFDNFKQSEILEMPYYHNGMDTVPGYLIDCKDDHTYLIFAPDMESAKYMRAYVDLFRIAKTRMSDHDYDPIRLCFRPAWTSEIDECTNSYKQLYAPASEMGKIYIVK